MREELLTLQRSLEKIELVEPAAPAPSEGWQRTLWGGQNCTEPRTGLRYHLLAVKRELSVNKALTVRCPTCGAAPGEECELTSGQPRIPTATAE
jgi:hypothetical protein